MIYIINKVCSEGYWFGNESSPYASTKMGEVIKDAYYDVAGYKATYEGEEKPCDDEPMLSFKDFEKIMKTGFDRGFSEDEGYVVIQYDDYHIQFEPYAVEV